MKQNFLFLIIFSILVTACNQQPKLIASSPAVQIDDHPSECPYLTKDNNGNTVLSWVRMVNDSTTAFCYATSHGNSFSQPVVIPNTGNIQPHGENLPKIIFKPSGEIIALWGAAHPTPKNKYSGMIFYTQSFDKGKTWTESRPLLTDTASKDQRYYDVALLPNGEAAIIWLDNRKTSNGEGSALYFANTSGNKGFNNGKLISQPCCPCCRTDLYVDKKGGIHALFRGILQDSIRDMVHVVSTDGGKTFSEPKRINEDNWVINGCPHTGPAMTENQDGIHFAWFTGGNSKGCYYTKTTDNGKSFQMHDSVSSLGSHPQLSALPGGDLFIVWDESNFENNKVIKRIGIQRRDPTGKRIGNDYLTGKDSNAGYPVIASLDQTSTVVAYSNKNGDKEFVTYQVVAIGN